MNLMDFFGKKTAEETKEIVEEGLTHLIDETIFEIFEKWAKEHKMAGELAIRFNQLADEEEGDDE